MHMKDLCEEANQAPRARLPKPLRHLRYIVDRLWNYRFPGVKKVKPFKPRIEL